MTAVIMHSFVRLIHSAVIRSLRNQEVGPDAPSLVSGQGRTWHGRIARLLVVGGVMIALAALPACDNAQSNGTEDPPIVDTGDPCPEGMAHVEGFCIDRWEASIQDQSPFQVPSSGVAVTLPGVTPQGYISADVAEAVCQAAGKRLCTSSEWLRACGGPTGTQYPYGNTYRSGACNEGRTVHPVIELFGDGANWGPVQMNDPRLNQLPASLDLTGANEQCVSADSVFDLHGNLHEWVADTDGTFRGGFYVDASINGRGCDYRTTAHGRSYHDYSTGFRCCADPE